MAAITWKNMPTTVGNANYTGAFSNMRAAVEDVNKIPETYKKELDRQTQENTGMLLNTIASAKTQEELDKAMALTNNQAVDGKYDTQLIDWNKLQQARQNAQQNVYKEMLGKDSSLDLSPEGKQQMQAAYDDILKGKIPVLPDNPNLSAATLQHIDDKSLVVADREDQQKHDYGLANQRHKNALGLLDHGYARADKLKEDNYRRQYLTSRAALGTITPEELEEATRLNISDKEIANSAQNIRENQLSASQNIDSNKKYAPAYFAALVQQKVNPGNIDTNVLPMKQAVAFLNNVSENNSQAEKQYKTTVETLSNNTKNSSAITQHIESLIQQSQNPNLSSVEKEAINNQLINLNKQKEKLNTTIQTDTLKLQDLQKQYEKTSTINGTVIADPLVNQSKSALTLDSKPVIQNTSEGRNIPANIAKDNLDKSDKVSALNLNTTSANPAVSSQQNNEVAGSSLDRSTIENTQATDDNSYVPLNQVQQNVTKAQSSQEETAKKIKAEAVNQVVQKNKKVYSESSKLNTTNYINNLLKNVNKKSLKNGDILKSSEQSIRDLKQKISKLDSVIQNFAKNPNLDQTPELYQAYKDAIAEKQALSQEKDQISIVDSKLRQLPDAESRRQVILRVKQQQEADKETQQQYYKNTYGVNITNPKFEGEKGQQLKDGLFQDIITDFRHQLSPNNKADIDNPNSSEMADISPNDLEDYIKQQLGTNKTFDTGFSLDEAKTLVNTAKQNLGVSYKTAVGMVKKIENTNGVYTSDTDFDHTLKMFSDPAVIAAANSMKSEIQEERFGNIPPEALQKEIDTVQADPKAVISSSQNEKNKNAAQELITKHTKLTPKDLKTTKDALARSKNKILKLKTLEQKRKSIQDQLHYYSNTASFTGDFQQAQKVQKLKKDLAKQETEYSKEMKNLLNNSVTAKEMKNLALMVQYKYPFKADEKALLETLLNANLPKVK